MKESEFLRYSAQTPMKELRRRFNQGQTLEQPAPEFVSRGEALEDVAYVRFVLCQAYSGYSYYPKSLFDRAFTNLERELQKGEAQVRVRNLMDWMGRQLSFLTDGHLSLTIPEYGVGFYQKCQTYVTDLNLEERDGAYFDTATGRQVTLGQGLRLFPSWGGHFLAGQRSKTALTEVGLTIGGRKERLPVHKIQSLPSGDEVLIRAEYDGTIAHVVSSSFVGDDPEALAKCCEIGRKCREYPHVIWDLSNNLGGNSEFARQFLLGLSGVRPSMGRVLSLNSTLVHAKEWGEIQEQPYGFAQEPQEPEEGACLFHGTLHVIVNDRVASSGESAVFMALSLPRVALYGCNTLGIGRFGDLCVYTLPNSHITLWCPQKAFEQAPEEGMGYEPGVWIDSQEVAEAVKRYVITL